MFPYRQFQQQKINTSQLFGDNENEEDMFFDNPDTSEVLQDDEDIFETNSVSSSAKAIQTSKERYLPKETTVQEEVDEEDMEEMEFDPLAGMVVGKKNKTEVKKNQTSSHASKSELLQGTIFLK